MTGRRVQDLMRMIDPAVRFMPARVEVWRADEIACMRRVPGCEAAPIYALFEDDRGHVCIGLAQDCASTTDPEEWVRDQLEYPVLRSIDRVDILGQIIREAKP
jgi:hypothetical protein